MWVRHALIRDGVALEGGGGYEGGLLVWMEREEGWL